jgi:hypothetical protein
LKYNLYNILKIQNKILLAAEEFNKILCNRIAPGHFEGLDPPILQDTKVLNLQ